MLGAVYVTLPAQTAFPYFSHFTPTSMLQSSIPASDSEGLVESFQWLSANIPNTAVLMTHNSMYGWAREYFHAGNLVIDYGPSVNLTEALHYTIHAGYAHIYTIWWADDLGWYGYPSAPLGFHLEKQFGNMGVFYYEMA